MHPQPSFGPPGISVSETSTAIWFAQTVGRQVRVIDYYEASGVDLGHYVREITGKHEYGGHIVPHDAQAKEMGTGRAVWKCCKASA